MEKTKKYNTLNIFLLCGFAMVAFYYTCAWSGVWDSSPESIQLREMFITVMFGTVIIAAIIEVLSFVKNY